jgi:hypothetical protein
VKGVQDALTRLSGVRKVTVKLQEGIVVVTTDSSRQVLPAAVWKEIVRVGFKPVEVEIRARGTFEGTAFAVDGHRWPVAGRVPAESGSRIARLRVREGAGDPPRVEVIE